MDSLERILKKSPLKVQYKWDYHNIFRGSSSVACCEAPLSYLSLLSSYSNKKRKVIREKEHERILFRWEEESRGKGGEEKGRVNVEIVKLGENQCIEEKEQSQPQLQENLQHQHQHQHQDDQHLPETLMEHLHSFRKGEREGSGEEEIHISSSVGVLPKVEGGKGVVGGGEEHQSLGIEEIEERVRQECLQWVGLSSLCEEEDEIEEDTDEEETEDEEDTEEETENTQEDTKEQLSEETKQNITISSLPFRVGLIAVVLCEKYAFFIRHPYKISLGMHNFLTQERERKGGLPSPLALSPSPAPSSQDGEEWSRCLWFSYQILMSYSFFHIQHHPIPLDLDKFPPSSSPPSLPSPPSSPPPSVMFGREAQLNPTTLWIQFVEQYPTPKELREEGERREGQKGFMREGQKGFIPPKWLWEKGVEWGVKGMMGGWVGGLVSNLDYLLFLNGVAGRRTGEPDAHPILPWVCDFTTKLPTPNRNLKHSKFRLAKGDHQLDYTYSNASPPHHVTEPLTDLTYYIYLARKTPLSVLKTYVRSNFRPDEYPSNMRKMYETTPHECVPEFFTDPSIFTPASSSSPPPLPPISLPTWASSPDDFVRKHREMLESEEVSSQLHHWIDLMFGFKLAGEAAIEAKNVPLLSSDKPGREWCGYVRLFSSPHPPTTFQEEIEEVGERSEEEKGEKKKEEEKEKEEDKKEKEEEKEEEKGVDGGESEEGDFLSLEEVEEEDIISALAQIPLPIAQTLHQCALSLSSFLFSSSSSPLPEARHEDEGIVIPKREPDTKKELALLLTSLLSPTSLPLLLSFLKKNREKGKGEGHKEESRDGKREEKEEKEKEALKKIPGFGKPSGGKKEKRGKNEGLERILGVISYSPLRYLLLLLLDEGEQNNKEGADLSMWDILCCILHSQEREISFPLSLSFPSSSHSPCSTSLFLSKIFSSPPPSPLSYASSYPPTHLSQRERRLIRETEKCFPPYFADLYAFFFIFYSISSFEEKAVYAKKFLPKMVASLSPDALSLFVVPLIKEILEFEDGKHSLHLMNIVKDLQFVIGADTFSTEIFPYLVKLYEKTKFCDLQNHLLGVPSVQFMWNVGGLGTTIRRILPYVIDGLKDPEFQTSAKASLVIMLPLIGPLIALKHLVLPLLKSLWRPHCPALLSCLEGMAIHFSEPLLIHVYIPHLLDNISKASELSNKKQFHVLLSSLILLESAIDILTPAEIIKHVLVDHHRIFSSLLSPSTHILIFFQLLALVVKMGREIGGSMAKKYLLPIVSQYFSYFGYFYDPITGKEKENSAMFSPAPSLPLSPLVNKELFDVEKGGRLWLFAAFGEKENFSEDFLNRLSVSLQGDQGKTDNQPGAGGLTTICSPEFASLLFREFDKIVGRADMEAEISNFEEIVMILNAHFPGCVHLHKAVELGEEEGMEGDEEGDEGISAEGESFGEEEFSDEDEKNMIVLDESVKFHVVLERKLKNAQKRLIQASKGGGVGGVGGGGGGRRGGEGGGGGMSGSTEKEGEREGGNQIGPQPHPSQMAHSGGGGEGGGGEGGGEGGGHWIQKFSQSSEMKWEKLFSLKIADNRPVTHVTHRNEHQLLVGTKNGICRFLTLGSEEQPNHHLKLSSQQITSLNFLGGNYLEAAIVSDPHTVHIWDYKQNALLQSYSPSFHHKERGGRGGLREGLSRGGGGGEMLVSGCFPLSAHHEAFLVGLKRGEGEEKKGGGEWGRGEKASVIRNGIHDWEALSFLGASPRIVLVDPLSQNGPSTVWVVPSSIIGQEIKQFYSLPGTPYFVLGGSNGRAALLDIRSGGIVSHWAVDPQGSAVQSISTASSFSLPSPSSSFQFLTLTGRTTKLWSVEGGTVISQQKDFSIPEYSSHFSQSEPTLRGAFTEFITTGNVPPTTTPFPSPLSQTPFSLFSTSDHSLCVLSRSYFASSSLLSQKHSVEMDPQPYPSMEGGVVSGVHLPCTGLTVLGTFNGSLSIFQ